MANVDQKLTISELDFNDIKTNLKNFLRDQQEFSDFDFEAAGINVILDILAYNTHYMAFYNNMIANEMFLDTALLRDSVVSHAKMLGYTPVSATSARAQVNLQIIRPQGNTQATLTLPKYTRFQSEAIDSTSYTFVNRGAAVANYDPTCNRFCFDNLYIYQGQPLTYTFTYDSTSNPEQAFELPDVGVDTASLEVIVQESATSLRSEKYIFAPRATSTSNTSAVFFLDEVRGGKYKVYFGDGVIGKSLTNGNVVIVNYLKTEGAAANKANAFTLVQPVGGFTNAIVYPLVAAAGGSSVESSERVRYAATKAFTSNNRGVTKDDIIALINQNYPYFEAVNVWGGEENVPPVYGKVYIAAKPSNGYEITESEKLTVINEIIKPVSVVTVIPEFVDVDYNYLNIFAEVFYDPTKTNLSQDGISAVIRNAIISYKNADLDNFNSRFKLSKLLRYIDDSNISIAYSDAIATIEKRLVPQVGASRNYTLNFGVSLSREDTKYRIYSTPAFTKYDSEGALRKCFFEETPGTSSGIEAIEIIAAPTSYLSPPTISIVGDGFGANAYPIVVNGKITEVVIDNPGVNYTTATVTMYYQDEFDGTANFNVVLQGRYGVLRSFFFDDNNVKTVLNPEAGTIDYKEGKITLTQFDPFAIEDPLKILRIVAKPDTNSFESARSRIITIDEEDVSSITVNAKTID
jgi:hypothetical protein